MSENFDVGARIKQLRQKRSLTQEQLAFSADIAPAYLSQVENNEYHPTITVIERLCHALNVSLEFFFYEDDDTLSETDIIEQIAFHLKDKSDAEKKAYLQLIKQVCKIQDM